MASPANRRPPEMEAGETVNQPQEPAAKKRGWSTAFLMTGSALLGATAVAFWNRRTLANMRAQLLVEGAKPQARTRTEEESF